MKNACGASVAESGSPVLFVGIVVLTLAVLLVGVREIGVCVRGRSRIRQAYG